MALRFEISAEDGLARRGSLSTPRGRVETPAFMPVATLGAAKGLAPWDVEEAGASLLLANLYHLSLRPGIDAIVDAGGLQAFCGWRGPMLTDSGGYQVFSLASLRQLDEAGVTFRSHLDGSSLRFTPESVVEDQVRLGVEIAMVLDECPPWPVKKEVAREAMERTNRWAERSRECWPGGDRALFAIVQGGVFEELRGRAVERLAALEFDGYAIGGVSVGEPESERRRVVAQTAPLLPEDRPRYLMGVGTPADILAAVEQGVDLFDCVLPTRNARHGVLYTSEGVLRIKNARFRRDKRPPDEACGCPVCGRLSRAFLHHLVRSGEITGAVLASLHNLRFYLDFVSDLREAVASGRLADFGARVAAAYPSQVSRSGASDEADSGAS